MILLLTGAMVASMQVQTMQFNEQKYQEKIAIHQVKQTQKDAKDLVEKIKQRVEEAAQEIAKELGEAVDKIEETINHFINKYHLVG
jgi:S-methylmethionine-dependent homocysteine/selenocysteine methylase